MLRLYAITLTAPALAPPLVALEVGSLIVIGARCRKVPAATPAALRAHDRVVRGIAAPAILPCRFGLVAAEATLSATILPLVPALRRALALVRNRVQYTYRVYGEALPQKQNTRGGVGTRWLAAKRAANAIPEAAGLERALGRWVVATKTERHHRAPLIGSVYHLVGRRDLPAYERARDAFGAQSSTMTRERRFESSGPWPVYAFSDLA